MIEWYTVTHNYKNTDRKEVSLNYGSFWNVLAYCRSWLLPQYLSHPKHHFATKDFQKDDGECVRTALYMHDTNSSRVFFGALDGSRRAFNRLSLFRAGGRRVWISVWLKACVVSDHPLNDVAGTDGRCRVWVWVWPEASSSLQPETLQWS